MALTLDYLKSLPENVGFSDVKGTTSSTIKRQGDTLLFTARSHSLPPVVIYGQRKQITAEHTATHKARMPFLELKIFIAVCLSFLLLIAGRKILGKSC